MLGKFCEAVRPSTQIGVVVSQIGLLADDANGAATLQHPLANAGIEHRGLKPRIGTDQQDGVGLFDRGDAGVEKVTGPATQLAQRRSVLAAIDVFDAQLLRQLTNRESFFSTYQIAQDDADAVGLRRLHFLGNAEESFGPGGGAQLAEFAHVGPVEPLTLQAVPDEARLVGNPFLVHVFMGARQDAHHFAATRVNADVGAQRIHRVDGLGLAQFPRPRLELVRRAHQCAHRAQVDDVALKLG